MSAAAADPYQTLVLAIVHRAVQDAQGLCIAPGTTSVVQIQQEARAWLADEAAVAGLLELGGYDAAVVIHRLRQWPSQAQTPGR